MVLEIHASDLAASLGSARDTRALIVGAGVLPRVAAVFREQFGDTPAVLIADENSLAAAGRQVAAAFEAAGHPCLNPFIFREPGLYAEHTYVASLEAHLESHAAIPVAVGAGTINDLTKLAAHRAGRQYLCVPTAASMDGYSAFGASITLNGSKQTFACPAPRAIVADLDVILGAPAEMNAWGYADLIAKVTAGADWIVADALGVEPLVPQAWEIVQGSLRRLISDPGGVAARRKDAIALLTEGLMVSGLAMQQAQSSRPASGAEHQFSHLWDMQHHEHNGCAPSHGFKVGIGTVAVTALYEFLLEQPIQSLDVDSCCARWPGDAARESTVRELFGQTDLARIALEESRAKSIEPPALRVQLNNLREVWPRLKTRLREQLLPLAELRARLIACGAPTEPEAIGLSRSRLRASFAQAQLIRRRFTVLDLAVRTQLLEPALNRSFGPGGVLATPALPQTARA